MSEFIHLRVHTAYSLSEGAIKIPELVGLCQDMKMPAVAVTDTNNLFGALEFSTVASKGGVQPIIGIQIDLNVLEKQRMGPLAKPDLKQIVLLAQNETGYQNLLKLSSAAFLGVEAQDPPHINRSLLMRHSQGLILLSGGAKGPLNQLILHHKTDEALEILNFFKETFSGRFYIELQRHGDPVEVQTEEALLDLAYTHDIPLVATNDCFFSTRQMYEAHDVLLSNAQGTTILDENRRRLTPEHYFKSASEMAEVFQDLPEAIENTVLIARRCSFMPEERAPILPPFPTLNGRAETDELAIQARAGLEDRLENFVFTPEMSEQERQKISSPYRDQLEMELQVINSMGFAGYFLIVSDFMKWCVEHALPIGPGRGSGAGSVVAWALKITKLDPLRWGLLFERFLNPERVSMPDFDIDFCQERRDEVIEYVQQKYGSDRVAQIITFGKLQARAVVRDVGRVLALPYGQVDRIAKMIPHNPANPITLAEALESDEELQKQRQEDEDIDRLMTIALQLEGLYRHASTHAAGVVIGDRALDELIPLYRDPKSSMPVTQFDMKRVEKAGLVKFDFLGLKTLTVIEKAVRLIKVHKGIDLDIDSIPLDDKKTYEMLARGETTGVFQLESAGMRDVLKKLQIDRFEDIIAVVSLYRPGPMDNIPSFIARKHGREVPDYLHHTLEPILKETFGIMIYQEQVMKIAQVLSGYTLGGADLLRRAMGKKIQAEMDAQRKTFVEGAAKTHHVPEAQANDIFDKVAKFAGYGFNKSHAAAYAMVAYQTAYLKANFPHEFMAATMTLDMGNTDKLAIFRQELVRMKIDLMPPCINASQADFSIEKSADRDVIRYALGAIKGAGSAAMQMLVEERDNHGRYQSAEDLCQRLNTKVLNKRQLEALCYAGAFDTLCANRASVLATIEPLLHRAHKHHEEQGSNQAHLFGSEEALSPFAFDWVPADSWPALKRLQHEYEAIGFYLSAHPLDGYSSVMNHPDITRAIDIPQKVESIRNATRLKLVGVVTSMKQRTSQRGNRYAFVSLSDSTGVYEVMIFSDLLSGSRDVLESNKPLLLHVEVQIDEEGYRLTCHSIQELDKVMDSFTRKIELTITRDDQLEKILTCLKAQASGTCHLYLKLQTEDHNLEIRLPRPFSLDAEVLTHLHLLTQA